MAQITFKGNPVETAGTLVKVGEKAPAFSLVAKDLSEKSLDDFAGKTVVLTINPSFDTGVCQATARRFHQELGGRSDVVVLAISKDLPFAQKRFCEAEGLENVVPLSAFRSSFARDYGVEQGSGPLKGLCARAVVVIGSDRQVKYLELVPEVVTEPNYDAAKAAI